MANKLRIQHGIIINSETTTDLSVIGFDQNDDVQAGKLIYDHITDAFIMNINGTEQIKVTNTVVDIGIGGAITTVNIGTGGTATSIDIGSASGTTTIAGDLVVNGTTTTVNSANVTVTDNIILLNDGEPGAGVTAGAAGIEIDRGPATDNAGWYFNESNDWWGPTGPSGTFGVGIGATQTIGNIAAIDSTDSTDQVLTIVATGALALPSGNTVARPSSPSAGMLRWNSLIPALEVYDGTDWGELSITVFGGSALATSDLDFINTFKILNPLDPTTANEVGDRGFNDARYLLEANNLSDLVNDATARTNLDVYSKGESDGLFVNIIGDAMSGDLLMAADILPDVDFTTTPRDIGKTNGIDGAGADLRFRAVHAETFHGTATTALYADLAERYEADAEYESGTVLVFGGEVEVTITEMYADTRVAGVVSTNPAFKMNSGAGFSDTHPYIALKGKVPCKVSGYIRKGDLLVTSSKPGYAVSVDSDQVIPYTAFARANEDFDGNEGVIEVSII